MALDVPETGLNAAVAVIIIIFPLSEEVNINVFNSID